MFVLGGLYVVVLRGRNMEVFKCDCLGCPARRICLSPVRTNQANERDIGPKKDEAEDLTFGSPGKAGGRKLGFQ
jgi:hypothetical protein